MDSHTYATSEGGSNYPLLLDLWKWVQYPPLLLFPCIESHGIHILIEAGL